MPDPVDNDGGGPDSTEIPEAQKGDSVEKLRQEYHIDLPKSSPTPKDAKEIEKLLNFPQKDDDKDADKIQFNADGTATLWTKDPDLKADPKNPRSPYAIDGFIDKDGTIHYLSEKDYADVASQSKKITDVMPAYKKR